VELLEELQLSDSTYLFITSDHGYNLGQHRLPSCKLNVYDHDLRIPMVVKGPGIAAGSTFALPASNVDVGPTLLGLAGVDGYAHETMDGRSVVPLLVNPADARVLPATRKHIRSEMARTKARFLGNGNGNGNINVNGARTSPAAAAAAVVVPAVAGGGGNVTAPGAAAPEGLPESFPQQPLAACDFAPADAAAAAADMQLAADAWRDVHLVEYYSLGAVTRTGHLVDDPNSNTYRAIRSVRGKYGNMLYSEFTAVADWHFQAVSFHEMFDMDKDPHQLDNIYANQTDAMKAELNALVDAEWKCNTSSCK
jgi:arylsulfatase A-like enzyme